MDSLLGAAAMGDIGVLFPDSDESYSGVDSMELMREVAVRLRARGFGIGNVDSTVTAQAPKLMPYIDEMRRRIAAALDVDMGRISVKATTEEGLGFTGDGQGISAYAVALLD
jgi:2-C-methyl-D-erythritol 2,4-cyclodiphosphate synthase